MSFKSLFRLSVWFVALAWSQPHEQSISGAVGGSYTPHVGYILCRDVNWVTVAWFDRLLAKKQYDSVITRLFNDNLFDYSNKQHTFVVLLVIITCTVVRVRQIKPFGQSYWSSCWWSWWLHDDKLQLQLFYAPKLHHPDICYIQFISLLPVQ